MNPRNKSPRWLELARDAESHLKLTGGFARSTPWEEQIAIAIMDTGKGQEFLKAVRRGRSTSKQNLRYRLLREVEKFCGAKVKRRRPDANTPDAVALGSINRPNGVGNGFLL